MYQSLFLFISHSDCICTFASLSSCIAYQLTQRYTSLVLECLFLTLSLTVDSTQFFSGQNRGTNNTVYPSDLSLSTIIKNVLKGYYEEGMWFHLTRNLEFFIWSVCFFFHSASFLFIKPLCTFHLACTLSHNRLK